MPCSRPSPDESTKPSVRLSDQTSGSDIFKGARKFLLLWQDAPRFTRSGPCRCLSHGVEAANHTWWFVDIHWVWTAVCYAPPHSLCGGAKGLTSDLAFVCSGARSSTLFLRQTTIRSFTRSTGQNSTATWSSPPHFPLLLLLLLTNNSNIFSHSLPHSLSSFIVSIPIPIPFWIARSIFQFSVPFPFSFPLFLFHSHSHSHSLFNPFFSFFNFSIPVPFLIPSLSLYIFIPIPNRFPRRNVKIA